MRNAGRVDHIDVEANRVEDLACARVLAGSSEASHFEGADRFAARFELVAPRREGHKMRLALSAREESRGSCATELPAADGIVVSLLERALTRDRLEENIAQENDLATHVRLEGLVFTRARVLVLEFVESDAKARPTLQRELEELHKSVHGHGETALGPWCWLEQVDEAQVIGQPLPERVRLRASEDLVRREALAGAVEGKA
jgi:hypothetical protein